MRADGDIGDEWKEDIEEYYDMNSEETDSWCRDKTAAFLLRDVTWKPDDLPDRSNFWHTD